MNSSLNIVLFGQTGSGKSSVVNLIAGREIAETSNGAAGCTLSFKVYTIFDTVGLDEPEVELNAIEQACGLIHHLSGIGGVDLLLFCIRAPRITATSQTNYPLFYEVLCRSVVPIASVITHLEREPDMEGWWTRNMKQMERFGLRFAGHACVTGLPQHDKYQESQRNIARLLEGHNSGGRFHMPPEGWFIEFSRSFGLFPSLKKEAKNEEILQILVKRCKMDVQKVEEVATLLEGGL